MLESFIGNVRSVFPQHTVDRLTLRNSSASRYKHPKRDDTDASKNCVESRCVTGVTRATVADTIYDVGLPYSAAL